MFTGIVEEVGTVKAAQSGKLTISAKQVIESTNKGDSIAVNGACLTVTELGDDYFSVDIMPETIRRTNLGMLSSGDPVKLERPLAVGGRLGGHFVQGHVDGMAKVISATQEGGAILLRFEASGEMMRYIVEKGFVAVDGVSLTVVEHDESSFKVSLVSYTLQNTNLGGKKPGDFVNIEVDIIAKYVERLRAGEGSAITEEFLAEHGFLNR